MTLKQHKMAKIIICKKYVLKICAILDNFGADDGFGMKIDNTEANKIPPSFFGMFFFGTFFEPLQNRPQNGENQNFSFPPEKQ